MAILVHIRILPTVVTAFLVASFACPATLATEPKRVIMLHSFGREFKPWRDYASTIRAELERQSPWPLDIQDQSLISARSSNEDPEAPFIGYLRALYSKNPPDLIVGIGAPAAVFVQRNRPQIFPNAPMVFTAMEQRRIDVSALTERDTVVAMTHDFAAAIENILRVLPDTKNVTVVSGYSPNERFWLEEIRREVRPLESRVAFTWTSHLSFGEILKHASELPPHSAIFWHTLYVDGAGVAHEGDSALKRLHAAAKAPIFSLFDVFLSGETVGGSMHSMLEAAQETAAVAIRILNGEKPGDIKVPPTRFAEPKFDWREMQHWGISESRLPQGSEILFRSPTAWEQYRLQILAVCAVLLMQGALISWLLYVQRQRSYSEAAAHELSGRLIHAQEEERSRLARELHDDVTQRLAMLAIDAGREERNLPSHTGGIAMRTMREGLIRLSEDVHGLSYRLHPSILEDLGLIEALKSECERFSRTSPTRLKINVEEGAEGLPPDTSLCLFRIAQEGLRNIERHAGASRAEVSLRRRDGGLQLAVSDAAALADDVFE